jgi:predicted lipoprotein with Yx(FWY)xxD motif
VKRLSILLLLAAALVGCGGGGGSSNSDSSSNATVSSKDGQLVDAKGAALYSSDQEKSGKVMCVDSCASIWVPLTSSGTPTAGDGVSGKLGTVKRPDGKSQVTLDGRPLYRFAEDSGSSKPTGDGVKDSFAGQSFSWHAEGSAGSSGSGSSGGGGSYSY